MNGQSPFQKLSGSLDAWKKKSSGIWGIWMEDLNTGEKWIWNEKQPFVAASMIKVPVMVAVYRAHALGKLCLSDRIELRREDRVGGSGVLQHLSYGTKFTIQDLVTLMIIQSDNTATNLLIDRLGKEFVQETLLALEMTDTVFINRLHIVPAGSNKTNQITAKDMARCFRLLATGQAVSRDASRKMVEILKKQQWRNCLPGRLPPSDSEIIGSLPRWEMAHKTGWVNQTLHDGGILYIASHSLILVVLSSGLDHHQSQREINHIGKWVYDAYTQASR
ncbi:serine hydrolase [Thermoactinomyces sp. CICC 10735]|uniref:serine hydrolase n=1 Tax=Thermoactinomyces sp. CICC 10735 TaxID=2767430 RepID=UPI0018DBE3DA|nr:serine hydrolase [Thermoactinomyces sp. CICC 10735]MBH8582409.1 serine hydrolase [Thermoactinomyces sp. CICC 10735]